MPIPITTAQLAAAAAAGVPRSESPSGGDRAARSNPPAGKTRDFDAQRLSLPSFATVSRAVLQSGHGRVDSRADIVGSAPKSASGAGLMESAAWGFLGLGTEDEAKDQWRHRQQRYTDAEHADMMRAAAHATEALGLEQRRLAATRVLHDLAGAQTLERQILASTPLPLPSATPTKSARWRAEMGLGGGERPGEGEGGAGEEGEEGEGEEDLAPAAPPAAPAAAPPPPAASTGLLRLAPASGYDVDASRSSSAYPSPSTSPPYAPGHGVGQAAVSLPTPGSAEAAAGGAAGDESNPLVTSFRSPCRAVEMTAAGLDGQTRSLAPDRPTCLSALRKRSKPAKRAEPRPPGWVGLSSPGSSGLSVPYDFSAGSMFSRILAERVDMGAHHQPSESATRSSASATSCD